MAYRRFLEATVQVEFAYAEWCFLPDSESGHTPQTAAAARHGYVQAVAELKCAMFDLELCAPFPVLLAAHDLFAVTPNVLDLGQPKKREFVDMVYELQRRQGAFLDAGRLDLAYDPQWWQLWGRFKAWRARRVGYGMVPVQPPTLPLAQRTRTEDGLKTEVETAGSDPQD
ncbi:hypothetical protein [Streptomyces sp. NPDC050388]|uniref:hypothetical protein n=1 Tax=Streptomyces sp. NPDC050388 TaxID=3155781 RepID=UPI003440C666